MKTEQLIYLDDIAKTHSISQTAQCFFISQQALSFSLSKLEEEFGVTFLERTNRGAELTPEGILFLEKSKIILDTYKDLKEELFFHTADVETLTPNSTLTIYSHTRILEPLLLNLLEQYTKKYPQVSIMLYENENIETIEKISAGEGDFGLIFAPDFIIDNQSEYHMPDNIGVEQLFSDKLVICCNKNSPFKNQKSIKTASLDNIPTILFDTNRHLLSLNGEPLSPITSNQYYSNNMSFHKAMVRRGLAISLITSFEFRKLYFKNKDVTALPIVDSPKSIIALITNKTKPITPAAQLFIDLLKKYDFYSL